MSVLGLKVMMVAVLGGMLMGLRLQRIRGADGLSAVEVGHLARRASTGPDNSPALGRRLDAVDSPLEALSSRAAMMRWARHAPDASPLASPRGAMAARDLLIALLEVPVVTTVKRGDATSDGLIRWGGEALALRITHGPPAQPGTMQVFFRTGESQVSFLTECSVHDNGDVTLALPNTVEQVDCRRLARLSLTEGGQILGLGFRVASQGRDFPVLDVSAAGISVHVPGRGQVPGIGDRVRGVIVFEGDPLVGFEAEVRNLTPGFQGTRMGLKLRQRDPDAPFTLDQVAEALAA